MLRARRSRRTEPLGVHLPDPVVTAAEAADPEEAALVVDSVAGALLVVLDPDVVLQADMGAALTGVPRARSCSAGRARSTSRCWWVVPPGCHVKDGRPASVGTFTVSGAGSYGSTSWRTRSAWLRCRRHCHCSRWRDLAGAPAQPPAVGWALIRTTDQSARMTGHG